MPDKTTLAIMIDDLVSAKTFSLDAMTAIQKLKERAEADALELMNMTIRHKNIQESHQILLSEVTELKAHATSVAEREKKMIDLEKALAVSEAKVTIQKDMFDRMFANRIIREANQTWVTPGPQGQPPYTMPNNTSKEEG